MKVLSTIILALSVATSGCEGDKPESSPSAWDGQAECTLRLVAYKTSKHSKYYLEEVGTGALFYMSQLGGRRIPTTELGGTVKSRCGYSKDGKRITEFYSYRKSIVTRTSGTVERSLAGYENLF
jgi:hypothetical protein